MYTYTPTHLEAIGTYHKAVSKTVAVAITRPTGPTWGGQRRFVMSAVASAARSAVGLRNRRRSTDGGPYLWVAVPFHIRTHLCDQELVGGGVRAAKAVARGW